MNKGEIVLFKFPFSNMKGYKKRPCIILSENIENDVMLCQITSKKPNKWFIEINNECFSNKSYIKINKIATVDISRVDKVIGQINNKEYNLLTEKISQLIR